MSLEALQKQYENASKGLLKTTKEIKGENITLINKNTMFAPLDAKSALPSKEIAISVSNSFKALNQKDLTQKDKDDNISNIQEKTNKRENQIIKMIEDSLVGKV
jgi:hypothetical protein